MLAALVLAAGSAAGSRGTARSQLVAAPPVALERDGPDLALAIEADRVVWIAEGEVTIGATSADIRHAILLCQDEHDLAVAEGCAGDRFAHEGPARRVHVPTFGIDRTEVTNAAWRRCVADARCVPSRIDDGDLRLAAPELPVAGVSAAEAEAFCAWAGGRLPSEIEWEKAARGDGSRRFPWGRFYHARLANHGRPPLRPDPGDGFRWASPVGSFPDGASPYGLLDVAGNVHEWTASSPSATDFELLGYADQDPAPYRVLRGGSWSHPAVALRVTSRAFLLASDARADVGLRCAYDPPQSAPATR